MTTYVTPYVSTDRPLLTIHCLSQLPTRINIARLYLIISLSTLLQLISMFACSWLLVKAGPRHANTWPGMEQLTCLLTYFVDFPVKKTTVIRNESLQRTASPPQHAITTASMTVAATACNHYRLPTFDATLTATLPVPIYSDARTTSHYIINTPSLVPRAASPRGGFLHLPLTLCHH